jgi:hypothetical protein
MTTQENFPGYPAPRLKSSAAAPNIAYVLLLVSILVAVLLIAGSGTLAYAITHAQEGFEDETGFHPVPPASDSVAGSVRTEERSGDRSLPHLIRGLPSL